MKWSACVQVMNNYSLKYLTVYKYAGKGLLTADLWLSTGQLEHYFKLSGARFCCTG